MKYFEFGQEHPELMVMLHGGGVCYRGALPVAEEMAKTYHLVLVAYDGFNPDEPETQFRSVPDEARRLGDYIVERYGGKIDILYGVSYGTFVLMDVLADKRLTITTTIANGMPTMDYADIKSPVLQNLYIFFLTGFSYWLIGKAGPIRKKLVCKMMGRTEESFDRIVYKDATWQSWVNQDKYMIGRHRNFDLFKRTDMYIWHGIASSTEKKLAKHVRAWQDKGYAFTYKVFPIWVTAHWRANTRGSFQKRCRRRTSAACKGEAMRDNKLQFNRSCHVLYSKACKSRFNRRLPCIIRKRSARPSGSGCSGSMWNFSRTGGRTWAGRKTFTTARAALTTASLS